jgi:galactoside O-acetyltransferase
MLQNFLEVILSELQTWLEAFVSHVPGRIGIYLRRAYYSLLMDCGGNLVLGTCVSITGFRNIKLGNNVSIMKRSSLHAEGAKLTIGDNVSINTNSCVVASDGGSIEIGNDVLIAQNVVLRASDHEHLSVSMPIRYQGHTGGRIIIGSGVWICANCVITRDVSIGEHSIVAAGAVVTNDVEPYSVVGGIPAKMIRMRQANDTATGRDESAGPEDLTKRG